MNSKPAASLRNSDMIKIYLRGGLGNQLFQYGAALNLAEKLNFPIIADDLFVSPATTNKNAGYRVNELNSFKNDLIFNSRSDSVKNRVLSKVVARQRVLGDHFPQIMIGMGYFANERQDQLEDFLQIKKSVIINSYCGRPEFFGSAKIKLAKHLIAISNPTDWFTQNNKTIKTDSITGIHVRLGDYKNAKHIYGIPDVNYYVKSLNLLEAINGKKPVWLFSDEPAEAFNLLKNKVKIDEVLKAPEESRPIETLNLLGNCANIVCANSSFSWWAGFLATERSENSRIIFPRPMFNDSKMKEPFNWLPENWITVGRKID